MAKPENQTDHRMALHTAFGYRKIAQNYFGQFQGLELKQILEIAVNSPGDAICASTNLCLAIELYLKSIKVGLGEKVKQSHNRLALFSNLPPETRRVLAGMYEKHLMSFEEKQLKSFAIIINSAYDSPKKSTGFNNKNKSLTSVLERCSNGFIGWRYFFETMEVGETQSRLEIEYDHLDQIGNVLHSFILANDAKFESNSINAILSKRNKPIAKDSLLFTQSQRQISKVKKEH